MHWLRNIGLAIILLLWGSPSWSRVTPENDRPVGQLISIADAGSAYEIQSIYQDSLGFLWIGTRGGLYKYDGYGFLRFRQQRDTLSIRGNQVFTILEGKDGVLWIGTNRGLNKLDRHRGYSWSFHPLPESGHPGDSAKEVHDLIPAEDNSLWVRTRQGLWIFDILSERFHLISRYQDTKQQPTFSFPLRLIRDGSKTLWMNGGNGLLRLDPASGEQVIFNTSNGLGSDTIRAMCSGPDGTFWAGTDNGLYRHSPGKEGFVPFRSLPSGSSVNHVATGRNGSLFVTTRDGYYRIPVAGDTAFLQKEYRRRDMIARLWRPGIIYEDRTRVLWIGTGGGLVKIDQKPAKFNLRSNIHHPVENLSSHAASCIMEAANGDLWIGTPGNGLNLLGDRQDRARIWLDNEHIYSILQREDGSIWAGTANGVYTSYGNVAGFRSGGLQGRKVYAMVQGPRKLIWCGTDEGLYVYYPMTGRWKQQVFADHGLERFDLLDIYCLAFDDSDHLWIGAVNGLLHFRPLLEQYNIFHSHHLGVSKGLSSNTVFSIHADATGRVWIGTSSGLNYIDPEGRQVLQVDNPAVLDELRIYGILEDDGGYLWLSSDEGLWKYHPKLETLQRYGPGSNVQGEEYLPGSAFQTGDGHMYFGGVAGWNDFYPDLVRYNPHVPEVAFTEFFLVDAEGTPSAPILLDQVSSVTVPRGITNIAVRFAAMDFTAPSQNQYLYRLVKNQEEGLWIHLGTNHSVSFDRLDPGNYTLSVRGSNNDLVFTEDPVMLEIVVRHPFWVQSTGVGILILVLGVILLIAIQWRTRRLRKANRHLMEQQVSAKEVARQREELEYQNKSMRDSIIYAKRIQSALLPTEDTFSNILPESFVLFKPKDIVSGDFYWINQHGNKVYVAAVDCTGHGVPGAFVSIIGFELFRKITAGEQGSNPAMILDSLNENFSEIFSDGEQVYLNDGMDLSLCIIDRKEKTLDYSGAFNPLYLVRNETIIEVKADRFSVGADVYLTKQRRQLFKSHKIFLQEDDMLYLFSDGYADQFGGPEGKKFKYRRFRHLLLTIHKLPMARQQELLDSSIEEWKGDLDQIDDILVIGIRPLN